MGCFYVAKWRNCLEKEKPRSTKLYNSLYDNQPALLPNPQMVGALHHQRLLFAPSQILASELDLHQVRSDGFPTCTAANHTIAPSGLSINSNKSSPEVAEPLGRPVPLPLPLEAERPLPLPLQKSSSLAKSRSNSQFESSKTFQSFSFGSKPQPLPLPSQVEITSLRMFRHEEILAGCGNFSPSHWLRDNCVGQVYLCMVKEPGNRKEMEVAVTRMSGSNIKAANECLSTFEALAMVQSPYISRLLGFCMPKVAGSEWLLVSEHVESESLEALLRNQSILDWSARMKIALGIARGLENLNTSFPLQGCLDGDFDLCNIQIDKNGHPILSDYGFRHVLKHDVIEDACISTNLGKSASEKIAVKNFGKLLLALIIAPEHLDKIVSMNSKALQTVRPFLDDATKFGSIVDPALKGQLMAGSLKKVVMLVRRCLQQPVEMRPRLQEVLEVLFSILYLKKTKSLKSFKVPSTALGYDFPLLPRTMRTEAAAPKVFELPQLVADKPVEDQKVQKQPAMGATQIPLQPMSTNAVAVAVTRPVRTLSGKPNYRPLQKHTQMPNLRCSSSFERHELSMDLFRANMFQIS